MKYTEKQLFEFMDAQRPVRVTCDTGGVFEGMCWAYSATHNESEEGRNEASLDVENISLYLSEITEIEYL